MRRIPICLLAAGAGAMGVVGLAPAPARAQAGSSAVQLSQGVAPPTVAATQAPRADGSQASASALSAPSPEGVSASPSYGFDACATPSQRAMNAWTKSPYRSIGVYIGGVNRACAQQNLTAEWVTAQLAAGWHLIPTYVGLQAPGSSCCIPLNPNKASAQGTAAAKDAVSDAQAIGIGAGSPIYFDMEGYSRTAAVSRAVLTFLEAWTKELHALGYISGVYSSRDSGIVDLAAQIGTGYAEPDDIWIADWNGQANTEASLLPSYAWAPHHRLHQYEGGHKETYGGVTIDVDNDYVDGDVVGAAAPPPPLSVSRVTASGATVSVTVACGWSPETSCPGQILLRTHLLVPVRGARRTGLTRSVRVGVGRRAFHLVGGRSHTYRVALNARGRSLLRARRRMRAQLLVAIPGARVTRALSLIAGR